MTELAWPGYAPPGRFEFNDRSPLARGLVVWVPLLLPLTYDFRGGLSFSANGAPEIRVAERWRTMWFDGTDDAWLSTVTPLTAVPLSMACWFNTTDTTGTPTLISISDAAGTANEFGLGLRGDTAGDPVGAYSRAGGSVTAQTSTGYSANKWHFATGTFTSATSRAAYIDGGSKGTNTNNSTPAGLDRIGIGVKARSTLSDFFTGYIFNVCLWDRVLPDEEVLYAYRNPFDLYRPLPRVFVVSAPAAGGTTYQQGVGGSLTPSGALTKEAHKALAGSLAPSGSLTKETAKALAGSLGLAGTLTKTAKKALAGALTPSGELSPSLQAGTFPLTAVLDSFDRSDSATTLGADWTEFGGAADIFGIASNQAYNPDGVARYIYFDPRQYGADSEVYITVGTWPSSDDVVHLYARLKEMTAAFSTFDGYRLRAYEFGTDSISVARVDDSVATQLGASVSPTLGAGDKIGLRVEGSLITAWHDSGSGFEQLLSRSDTTYSAAGYLGFYAPADSDWRLNDFGGGGIFRQSLAGSIAPSGDLTGEETFPKTDVLDDFNRADSSDLGSDWTAPVNSGNSSPAIASNQCAPAGTASDAYWDVETFGPDSEAYITIATKPGNTEYAGVVLRVASPGGAGLDGYAATLTTAAGTDEVKLYRIDNAVATQLGATISQEFSAGDGLGLEAEGSALTAYRRSSGTWSSLGSRTDETYDSAGYIGLLMSGSTVRIDDFGGGEMEEGPTTYQQSVGGSLGLAGTVTKETHKVLAGALGLAGALVKKAKKALSGIFAPSGSVTGQELYLQALAGSLGLAGVLGTSKIPRLLDAQKTLGGEPVVTLTIGAHTLTDYIVAYKYEEEAEHAGSLAIWLDNREGEFNDLTNDYPGIKRGAAIDLRRGLRRQGTSGTTVTSTEKLPRCWIDSLQYVHDNGAGMLLLDCIDWWGKLENYRFASLQTWSAEDVRDIAEDIVQAVGLTLQSGTFGQTIDYQVEVTEDADEALKDLMRRVLEFLYTDVDGAIKYKQLDSEEEAGYAYDFQNGASGHPLLLESEIAESSAEFNKVVVNSVVVDEEGGETTYTGSAEDTDEIALVGTRLETITDNNLASNAQCAERAEAELSFYLARRTAGTLVARPHFTLRLYDVVSIAAPPWGGPALAAARVTGIREVYGFGEWEQEIIVGNLPERALVHVEQRHGQIGAGVGAAPGGGGGARGSRTGSKRSSAQRKTSKRVVKEATKTATDRRQYALKDHVHKATALSSGSVGSTQIANNSISQAKMQNNSIGSPEIIAGAVDTSELADGAVTTAKLDDLAVTAAKIANATITATQLANSAVTTNKIDNEAVVDAKMAADAVGTATIKNGAITYDKLAQSLKDLLGI